MLHDIIYLEIVVYCPKNDNCSVMNFDLTVHISRKISSSPTLVQVFSEASLAPTQHRNPLSSILALSRVHINLLI